MKLQGNILLLILALVLLATCTHATNVRIAGKLPNTINKEAVKIVLEEQSQHAAIENYYISQMDVMQDRMEAKQQTCQLNTIIYLYSNAAWHPKAVSPETAWYNPPLVRHYTTISAMGFHC